MSDVLINTDLCLVPHAFIEQYIKQEACIQPIVGGVKNDHKEEKLTT